MSLGRAKVNPYRDRTYIPISDFGCWDPTLEISSDAISGSLQLGLNEANNSAFLATNESSFSDTLLTIGRPVKPRAIGQTALYLESVGAMDVLGCQFSATSNGCRHMMHIPTEWSRKHPIYVRAIWMSDASAVGSRSVTWVLKWDAFGLGGNYTGSPVQLGVLNPLIAADAPSGGGTASLMASPAGTLPGESLLDTDYMFSFALGVSAITGFSGDEPFRVGVEFEYTQRHQGIRGEGKQFSATQ
jgi:hypothetical protein